MKIKQQLAKLHIYNLLFSLRITDAVWVVFLLARGFSLVQVGIAESVFHLVSFLFEIPSGMASDILGRKRTMAVAGLCGFFSAVFMAYSASFLGVCLSMIFNALMYNLCSGTQEAITYDSLMTAGREGDYLKVSALLLGIGQTASALCCALGGIALLMEYRSVYLISGGISLGCGLVALTLREPIVTEKQRARQERPFGDLWQRLREHICDSIAFLRHNPRTTCKCFADAAIGVPVFLSFMYLQQHLIDAGMQEVFLGVALLLIRLSGTAGVMFGSRIKMQLFRCIVLCGVCCGLGTIFAGIGWWPISIFGAMVTEFFCYCSNVRVDAAVNGDFPSDQRATLVSVGSMMYSMLMIVASAFSGAVGDILGTHWALWVLGLGLLVATPVFSILYRVTLGRRKRSR